MHYQGNKSSLNKWLIPIITENLDPENGTFIDMFAGGMNVISEVDCKNKIANDINKYVISLWQVILRDHILNKEPLSFIDPDKLTKEYYEQVKKYYLKTLSPEFNKHCVYDDYIPISIIGYVGTCCTYRSGWFNGYANPSVKKNGRVENYILEGYNGLKKHINNFKYLERTAFTNFSYDEYELNFRIEKDAVIYCDIPYINTKKYESDFDHKKFYRWVRDMSERGYKNIYISEYSMPDEFECISSYVRRSGTSACKEGDKPNERVEKIFKYKG